MYRTSVEPRRFLFLFFAVSALLTVSVFLVPFLSPYGSFVDLDGRPGVIDHWDIWSSEDPFTMVLAISKAIYYGLQAVSLRQSLFMTPKRK